MNISNNISSINAHQKMLSSNAHDIANVNTDRYVPNDAVISGKDGSVALNLRSADDNGSNKSQTDLAKEIPQQIIVGNVASVNASAIKAQDEMLGSLLDIKV